MAFYNQSDEEQVEDPNAASAPQSGQQGGSVISGQGASNSTGPTTPAASAPTPAAAEPASGAGTGGASPFVGIKQYLDANKSQSTKLANDTAGVVNQATQQARDTLPKQTDLYNQAVTQNTVGLDQGLFEEAKTKAQNVAADNAKKASFIKMRDANYAGPSDLQSSEFYRPVDQAYQKADTAAKNTLTEGGQAQLLTDLQQQTRGKVNQSAINLDKLLLRGDESKNILAKSVEAQADLQPLLQNAQAQSIAKATEGKNTTDATRNAIQSAFTGADGVQEKLKNEVAARVDQISSQGNKQADTLKKLLAGGKTPSAADLKVLGVSAKEFQNLQGLIGSYEKVKTQAKSDYNEMKATIDAMNKGGFFKEKIGYDQIDPNFTKTMKMADQDLSKFLNISNGVNANTAASAEEFARYGALNDLMGTSNSYLSDASKAGTASSDFADFNYSRATQTVKDAIALAQKSMTDAYAKLNKNKKDSASYDEQQNKAMEQGVGQLFGATVGAAFGGANGAAIGAVIGGALGKPIKNTFDTAGNTVFKGAKSKEFKNSTAAVNPVHGVSQVASLCFVEDTPILMADGSYKPVEDLKLGDVTAIGGKVTFHGVGITDIVIEYKGRFTSPSHAIFDGEKWARAEDLTEGFDFEAAELDAPEGILVYPVSTEFHRLISDNGVVYADFDELDASSDLTDKEIIEQMNKSVALGADKLCHESLQNKVSDDFSLVEAEGIN